MATLVRCLERTKNLSAHWKHLGLLLKLEKHLLDAIEKNYPRDVETCRMEMLDKWLNRSNAADSAAELDAAIKEFETSHNSVKGEYSLH